MKRRVGDGEDTEGAIAEFVHGHGAGEIPRRPVEVLVRDEDAVLPPELPRPCSVRQAVFYPQPHGQADEPPRVPALGGRKVFGV